MHLIDRLMAAVYRALRGAQEREQDRADPWHTQEYIEAFAGKGARPTGVGSILPPSVIEQLDQLSRHSQAGEAPPPPGPPPSPSYTDINVKVRR